MLVLSMLVDTFGIINLTIADVKSEDKKLTIWKRFEKNITYLPDYCLTYWLKYHNFKNDCRRICHPFHFHLLTSFLQVGDFAIDNRAGISRTLHRISAIRNRKGDIIGLTCRVGRAVSGSANLLRDLVQDGASLLLIGPPGVGKTTIIRFIIFLKYFHACILCCIFSLTSLLHWFWLIKGLMRERRVLKWCTVKLLLSVIVLIMSRL